MRALLLLLVACSSPSQESFTSAPIILRPAPLGADVLIVVLDDVSSFDLDLYGGAVETPNLSALADAGVVFERAYANGMCMPSRVSLSTGRWAIRGVGEHCDPASDLTPALATSFLPETAPAHTALLFGKWHLGAHQGGKAWQLAPISQGWDAWIAGHGGNTGSCGDGSYGSWLRVDATASGFTSATHVAYEPKAVRDAFLSTWPGLRSPKLALVSGQLAHGPFHIPPTDLLPPGSGFPGSDRGRYELMVAAGDTVLGEILAAVNLSKTLVVVFGDNGTPGQVAPDSTRAKFSSYERGVRVPLVIAGKGVSGGRRVDDLVHLVDVFSTASEAMGGSPWAVDGRSLWPILKDEMHAVPHEAVLVGHNWGSPGLPGNRACVRLDGMKLIQKDADGDEVVDSEELYDLTSDPLETSPLAPSGATYEDMVAALEALVGGA